MRDIFIFIWGYMFCKSLEWLALYPIAEASGVGFLIAIVIITGTMIVAFISAISLIAETWEKDPIKWEDKK